MNGEKDFCQIFEANIPTLKTSILEAFNNYESKGGYKVIWEEFEDVIDEPLQKFLKSNFTSSLDVIKNKSKSSFPDWKVLCEGKIFAIDVKSGEDKMDPWYDMGRLDTFEEKHIKHYEQEYYITVKWKKEKKKIKVVDIYIEPFYKSVGYDAKSKGVKFRPYDGKLRPKSWNDFTTRKSYWETKKDFLKGLSLSKKYRRNKFLSEWSKDMTSDEIEVILKKSPKIKS